MDQSEVYALPVGYEILDDFDDRWKLITFFVLYSVLELSLSFLIQKIIESHVTAHNTFNRCFSFQFQIRRADQ